MAKAALAETSNGTPERILVAALETFAEKGFEGAATREIAARAGVTLGLLQYHFGGKPKLWRAAVDRAFEEFRDGHGRVLEATEGAEDVERLRRLIHAHVRFVSRSPEFVRLMHDEGKRRGPRMRWLVDRHVKPMFETIAPLIRRLQEKGVLPSAIAPVHFVYALIGAVDVIFHQAEECKRVAGVDPSDKAVTEAHARAVEHLFLGAKNEENTQ